jgi:hypothetical protein
MKTLIKLIVFALFLASALFSCKKDEDKDPLQIPDNYDGVNYTTNTVSEYELRQQLKNLSTEMKKGRVSGITVDAATLNSLYNTGTFSLSYATTSQFKTKLTTIFAELAAASGGAFDPALTPAQNGEGGVFGGSTTFLFDENGLENEQVVEKGLFGAAMYHYAVTQYLSGDISLEDLDKSIALYGAHPDFPNSNKAANHTNPDEFLAGYAARRDDSSGNGVYLKVKKNFIKAQAAMKAGSDYNEELDEAVAAIKLNWEKGFAATVINYCFDAITKLSSTTPTDDTKAGALHGLSEALAFLYGLKYVPGKKISDTKIEEILTKLRNPESGTASMHEFVKNPVQAVTDIEATIALIKTEYGFTDAEVESFKLNQVNVREP